MCLVNISFDGDQCRSACLLCVCPLFSWWQHSLFHLGKCFLHCWFILVWLLSPPLPVGPRGGHTAQAWPVRPLYPLVAVTGSEMVTPACWSCKEDPSYGGGCWMGERMWAWTRRWASCCGVLSTCEGAGLAGRHRSCFSVWLQLYLFIPKLQHACTSQLLEPKHSLLKF